MVVGIVVVVVQAGIMTGVTVLIVAEVGVPVAASIGAAATTSSFTRRTSLNVDFDREASMRLASASPAEQNAAFNVVYWDLVALVKELPGIAQGAATDKLNSADGRAHILKVLNDAFDAAEKVRNAEAKK
jgi:hypothetical protein